MEFIVLASGSKGNATYLEIGNHKILIDCGLSYKQIKLRLAEKGKNLDGLSKVFITHEHSDHVKDLSMVAKNHDVDIYLSEGTLSHLKKKIKYEIDVRKFKPVLQEETLEFDGYQVMPFMVYHDAYEPFGYKFVENQKSIVYMTDTGYFPERKYHLVNNAEAYIIESNHEVEMLLESKRPWLLKRRILDDEGHLSNEDSANLLLNLAGEKTKVIVLAHLSEECNIETRALETYNKVFLEQGVDIYSYRIVVAKQDKATEIISIS
ncbi:MAG: MBL fold metallo-hydrolase [Tenericutes bacterium]|nr:MBL fold metallo-hydrolase [Mycoplasmatota bacterium]